eukprot:TRINITY_DN16257_c0_g2_i1.p2 TRINITY_DN16257_c0_g2~~TRINITY_DN16257_c0_g2_i1.p2  ORF type:complete len:266 (-),score=67.26 TRINITY_DN16257_c0_g2_i1:387-1184(-)
MAWTLPTQQPRAAAPTAVTGGPSRSRGGGQGKQKRQRARTLQDLQQQDVDVRSEISDMSGYSGRPRARRNEMGTEELDDIYDFLRQMGVSLSNALQRIQQLEGASWTTYVGPASHRGVLVAREKSKAYATEVSGKRGEHQLGPPQIHTLQGLMQGLTEQDDPKLDKEIKLLRVATEQVMKMDKEDVCDVVKMCCVINCRKQNNKDQQAKILLNVDMNFQHDGQTYKLQKLMQTILCGQGFTRKHGRTPTAPHQVRLQQMLEYTQR